MRARYFFIFVIEKVNLVLVYERNILTAKGLWHQQTGIQYTTWHKANENNFRLKHSINKTKPPIQIFNWTRPKGKETSQNILIRNKDKPNIEREYGHVRPTEGSDIHRVHSKASLHVVPRVKNNSMDAQQHRNLQHGLFLFVRNPPPFRFEWIIFHVICLALCHLMNAAWQYCLNIVIYIPLYLYIDKSYVKTLCKAV